MPVTMSSNYKEVFSKETVEQIEELIEFDYQLNEVLDFLDTYGEDKVEYFEPYSQAIENIGCDDAQEVVDRYVDSNGIEYVEGCDELYQGNYQSVEEFIDVMELIDYDIPSWLCIDYEATWDSALRFDYDKIDAPYGYDFWRIN
tara:strand:- start:1131 stop:1562 length:432 start_codon:yes stop_codon:yes gene_type:complete